jgi:hypothetical protein
MDGFLRANDIYICDYIPLNEILVSSISIDACVGLSHGKIFLDRTM